MEGLVHILLRGGDIILEAVRNGLEKVVHKTENIVASVNVVADYAHRINIINLLEGFSKGVNLAVNSVNALDPSGKGRFEIFADKSFVYLVLEMFEEGLLLSFRKFHALFDIFITHRVKNPDAPVLKFLHDGSDTEPVGKRSINLHCFVGGAALFFHGFCVDGPHIMKAVRKFYDDNADILRHGNHHFADVFRLGFLF